MPNIERNSAVLRNIPVIPICFGASRHREIMACGGVTEASWQTQMILTNVSSNDSIPFISWAVAPSDDENVARACTRLGNTMQEMALCPGRGELRLRV
jgi:hypothetical protein